MKYRKKPVVIEAHLYDGDINKAFKWVETLPPGEDTYLTSWSSSDTLYVVTLEGKMAVPVGNFIICGVEGELYSCDPVIFELTYEKVEE